MLYPRGAMHPCHNYAPLSCIPLIHSGVSFNIFYLVRLVGKVREDCTTIRSFVLYACIKFLLLRNKKVTLNIEHVESVLII